MTTKTQQVQKEAEDLFLGSDVNLDLSGVPSFAESIKEESFTDDRFGGLVQESRVSLRKAIPEFANTDAEAQKVLRDRGVVDEGAPHKFYLSRGEEEAVVYLGKDKIWRVTVFFDGSQRTIKCSAATNRDDAMSGANRWLNSKRGPQIRTLTQDQELYVARLAGMGRFSDAILNFLAYSVPDYEGTDISSDPKYTDVCNRCAWFVFIHGTPQYQDSAEAREFMTAYVGDRPATVELLQFAFKGYLEQKAKAERGLLLNQIENRDNQTDSQGPSYEELDELSTEEIAKLREDTLRLRAKQVKGGILQ